MKQMYGYVRVSTNKQGETTSLAEQQLAITKYAIDHDFMVIDWFEEKKTAAKIGRPAFNQMLKQLKQGKAEGIIVHKIDRSTRNVHDWSAISGLSDLGFGVHFAHDNIDLSTRSGRLTADIIAMVASDYVRNLSDEAFKGIMGRLRQGLLPNRAPFGYINTGGGNVKTPNKKTAPLVIEAFEKYATGKYTMNELRLSLYEKGLTNNCGNVISKTRFSNMLRNPFYIGILRYKSSEEDFSGKHEPLIPVKLFNQVQEQLGTKTIAKRTRHNHLFKTHIFCQRCEGVLTGELQKGHVYYRCHKKSCPKTSIREDKVENIVGTFFERLAYPKEIQKQVIKKLDASQVKDDSQRELKALNLKIGDAKNRLKSLEEKFIRNYLDHETFTQHKNDITKEIKGLEQQQNNTQKGVSKIVQTKQKFELCQNAHDIYKNAEKEGKRKYIELFISNIVLNTDKQPMVEPKQTFMDYIKTQWVINCGECAPCFRTICSQCSFQKRKYGIKEILIPLKRS